MYYQFVHLRYVEVSFHMFLLSLAALHCGLATQEVIEALVELLHTPDPTNAIHIACASALYHFSCLHGKHSTVAPSLISRFG